MKNEEVTPLSVSELLSQNRKQNWQDIGCLCAILWGIHKPTPREHS